MSFNIHAHGYIHLISTVRDASVTVQECFTVSDIESVHLSLSSTVTCAQRPHKCVFTNSLSTNTESVTVIPVCFYKRNPFTHPAAVYAGLLVFNNTVSKTEQC